jgi:hypothetical protein
MRFKQTKARSVVCTRPAYEPDNGPLTERQIEALQRMAPRGKMKVISSLL